MSAVEGGSIGRSADLSSLNSGASDAVAKPIDIVVELRGFPSGYSSAEILAGHVRIEHLDSEHPTLISGTWTFRGTFVQTIGTTLITEAGAGTGAAAVVGLTSRRLIFQLVESAA